MHFKSNKRILLILLKEKILSIDNSIVQQMSLCNNYLEYFFPEVKSFLSQKLVDKIESKLPKDFEEKREIGENENYICRLIRDDLIEDFIAYFNKENVDLDTTINTSDSIFETNFFLTLKTNTTLIEYAAFFGSIKVFNYLQSNKATLDSSSWLYAIHSNSSKIIKYLEDNQIMPEDETYMECFIEAIKSHQNNIAYYFENNFMDNENINKMKISVKSLKYYNFNFIDTNLIDESYKSFCYLCEFGYFIPVKIILDKRQSNPFTRPAIVNFHFGMLFLSKC